MSARLILEFKVADGSTRSVLVDATEPVLLGRSEECAVVLNDRSVSARHAEIRVIDGRPQVRDTASRWGTFVGRIRIEGWSEVPDGSMVWLGGLALSMRVEDTSPPPPPDAASPSETRTIAPDLVPPPKRASTTIEEDDSLASVIVRPLSASPPADSDEPHAAPATAPSCQAPQTMSGPQSPGSSSVGEWNMTRVLLLALSAGGVISGATLIWLGR